MNLKQLKFVLIRNIIKYGVWVNNRMFDLKLLYLKYFKYGGGKVPVEQYVASMSIDADFVNGMKTATAAGKVCEKLGLPETQSWVWTLVSGYLTNRLEKAEDAELAETLFSATNKKRTIFNLMLKEEDITERKVAFMFPGEKREELEAWLDNDEDL